MKIQEKKEKIITVRLTPHVYNKYSEILKFLDKDMSSDIRDLILTRIYAFQVDSFRMKILETEEKKVKKNDHL